MLLTAFVLDRLAEDTKAAAAASGDLGREWTGDGGNVYSGHPTMVVADCLDAAPASHIARHDPARVMADIEAKRRIVEAYLYLANDADMRVHAWTFAIRCLALPYAAHPDYRPEWETMSSAQTPDGRSPSQPASPNCSRHAERDCEWCRLDAKDNQV